MKLEDGPSQPCDIILAILYSVCFLLGTPANLLSFRYFLSQRPSLPILLYRVISATDACICLLSLPLLLSISTRRPVLYSYQVFCAMWGMSWRLLSKLSIILVAVICISRTYAVLLPFRKVNERRIMLGVGAYIVLAVLYQVTPVVFSLTVYQFNVNDSYCWELANSVSIEKLDSGVDIVIMALPLVPISLSCIITTVSLTRDKTLDNKSKAKRKATVTILIFTLIYIIFNIPNFVSYNLWMICFIKGSYPDPYFVGYFMTYYNWNLFNALSVCLNSSINPLVYYYRNKNFHNIILKFDASSKSSKSGAGVSGERSPMSGIRPQTADPLHYTPLECSGAGLSPLSRETSNVLYSPNPRPRPPYICQTALRS